MPTSVRFPLKIVSPSTTRNSDLSSTTPGWSAMASPSPRGSAPSSGASPSPSSAWAAWWAPSAWASWRTALAGRKVVLHSSDRGFLLTGTRHVSSRVLCFLEFCVFCVSLIGSNVAFYPFHSEFDLEHYNTISLFFLL